MTVAVDSTQAIAKPQFRIDLLKPVFWALAAVLAVLVVLPLAWLAYYALVDKNGQLTLANSRRWGDATLRRPFLIAIGMALSVGALSCAMPRRWPALVSRTDLPGRRLCGRWSPRPSSRHPSWARSPGNPWRRPTAA
jgi:iron(III) transport system permease protein